MLKVGIKSIATGVVNGVTWLETGENMNIISNTVTHDRDVAHTVSPIPKRTLSQPFPARSAFKKGKDYSVTRSVSHC